MQEGIQKTLRRLKCLGANSEQLLDIYGKQVRSLLEFAVPAWHGAITVVEKQDIEQIENVALHIIHEVKYDNYSDPLNLTNMEPLEKREKMTNFKCCSNRNLKYTLDMRMTNTGRL